MANPMAGRACVRCGATYEARTGSQKTCGPACSRELRLLTVRDIQKRSYRPRVRAATACTGCGVSVPPPRSGPLRKWCDRCRAAKEDVRQKRRLRGADRHCYKCGVHLPERAGAPSRTVCNVCRVDPRDPEATRRREALRRLRRYGLTQEQYDALFASQAGRCAGCRTDAPGVKGWCIDHCHTSGRVRAILCGRCNTMIGLADEDPAMLRQLADLVDSFRLIEGGA